MKLLRNCLHITVNELLSGETLCTSYQQKAEENLIGLIQEKETEKTGFKKIIVLQIFSLICAIIIWLLLFADSNIYQLGDSPPPLTLGYLITGFASIYSVIITIGCGILKKNLTMIFIALSFASLVCLLICLRYQTLWLIIPVLLGMFCCFILSLCSYVKNKQNRK